MIHVQVKNIKFWRTQSRHQVDFIVDEKTAIESKFNSRLFKDSKYNLWIGTTNGVYLYKDLNAESKPVFLLEGKNISSVIIDKEGGYWFSTLYNGIYYIPNFYLKVFNIQSKMFTDEILSVSFDSSLLWLSIKNKALGIKSNKIQKEINLDSENIVTRQILPIHK